MKKKCREKRKNDTMAELRDKMLKMQSKIPKNK